MLGNAQCVPEALLAKAGQNRKKSLAPAALCLQSSPSRPSHLNALLAEKVTLLQVDAACERNRLLQRMQQRTPLHSVSLNGTMLGERQLLDIIIDWHSLLYLLQIPDCNNAYCKFMLVHGDDWHVLDVR